ncbi:hypothetical protein DFH27DRAFT_574822 [Peziza echinospora]|nr:hypothetical protein DFH27DRAFT_574822 [Peziza echinospora]
MIILFFLAAAFCSHFLFSYFLHVGGIHWIVSGFTGFSFFFFVCVPPFRIPHIYQVLSFESFPFFPPLILFFAIYDHQTSKLLKL